MIEKKLEQAELSIANGEYRTAMSLLDEVISSTETKPKELCDAYFLRGTLVRVYPGSGQGDECGLSFFKHALSICPEHHMSLLGIVSTFGEHFPDHQDVGATLSAISKIESTEECSDLTPQMRDSISAKKKLVVSYQARSKGA